MWSSCQERFAEPPESWTRPPPGSAGAAPSAEPPVKPKHAWGRRGGQAGLLGNGAGEALHRLQGWPQVPGGLHPVASPAPLARPATTTPMAASQHSLLRRGPSRARTPPHSVGVHEAAQLDATWPRYGSWKRLLKQLINKLLETIRTLNCKHFSTGRPPAHGAFTRCRAPCRMMAPKLSLFHLLLPASTGALQAQRFTACRQENVRSTSPVCYEHTPLCQDSSLLWPRRPCPTRHRDLRT